MRAAAASLMLQIQDSKLRTQAVLAEERPKRTCRTRVAGLRRREAAARGAHAGANSAFKIQYSKLAFGPELANGLLERTCGTRTAGLRGAKLRPAAVPCRNRKFKIQDSKFRITCMLDSRYGWVQCSGRSLRRSHVRQRTAGLRRPQAAAPTVLTDRNRRKIPHRKQQPQPAAL